MRSVVGVIPRPRENRTTVCVSTALTRECKVVVENELSEPDERGHDQKRLACVLFHTDFGDSGGPVYQILRNASDGTRQASAAGWVATGRDNDGSSITCFVVPETVERDQQLKPLTVPRR